MLYPDLHDLIAFRNRKLGFRHPSSRSVQSPVAGNHSSPFRGQGLEFDAVREYVLGDDIRSIDWRVTARTGRPHVKLFKEDRERNLVICIDMNAAMRFGTRNTFKSVQAARIAAILGWQALASHDRVGACLFGDVPNSIQLIAPKRTKTAFCSILKTLSEPASGQHRVALKDALDHVMKAVHTGALVYLISDFMDMHDDSCESRISRLKKKCDVVFIAVNDPVDKVIWETAGMLGFSAQGQDKIFLNTAYAAGRKAYAAQWDASRRLLHETTSKFNIPLIELSTQSDVHRELALEIKKLSKGRKQ